MKVMFFCVLFLCLPLYGFAGTSTCYGTTSNGRLERGVKLPSKGKNYVSYSFIANAVGRTYVHSAVRDIIVDAYDDLAGEYPNKVFKYAETGFASGGEFKPHKTHHNGLSVDFMTPVIDENGISRHLPTTIFNKLGYAIEFNDKGEFGSLMIDYEALAAHIVALHQQALKREYNLWRVIFDPKLQPNLFKTKHAKYLRENIQFSKKRSWVRHDEHYHVDFAIPCLKDS